MISLPKKMRGSEKFIVFTLVIAVIALILPWYSTGDTGYSGFKQDGYIFLIFYIYPIYKIIRRENYNPRRYIFLGVAVAIVSYLFNIYRMERNVGEFTFPEIGILLFIINSIAFSVGNYLYLKGDKEYYRAKK